jgi:hypothetical protein
MALQRGMSKLELAVVTTIVGLLATVLLVRLAALEAESERLEVDLTVRNIRVGIQHAVGERVMRGEESRIPEIVSANPLSFLGHPASSSFAKSAQGRGGWSYDMQERELRYQPRSPGLSAESRDLRWRYVARRDSSGRIVGAALEAVN